MWPLISDANLPVFMLISSAMADEIALVCALGHTHANCTLRLTVALRWLVSFAAAAQVRYAFVRCTISIVAQVRDPTQWLFFVASSGLVGAERNERTKAKRNERMASNGMRARQPNWRQKSDD